MCGICGVVGDPLWTPPEATVVAMRDALIHRGPDDAGHLTAPGVALASRRLSIVDLSARGRMPMDTPDGRHTIVYNGEVYNAAQLRDELQRQGSDFRSRTDTEVVLALYARYGPAMLERLNGMFAMAIWDHRERTLFLARDRLGIKPLYFAEHDGALWFASEEKALFAAGLTPRIHDECWHELMCFRYVAGAATPFEGVRRLLPGHYLLWRAGAMQVRRWWHLGERSRGTAERIQADPAGWFRETFDDAVGLRRIADVPLGVLLSGGLDSGSVAASLASQSGGGVESFTVTFAEAGYDEGPLARQVAERWDLRYHELAVEPSDLLDQLRAATWLNDEPLVHGNELHLWAIAKYAKPYVTVLLSGEGGDETLGGYLRYRPLHHPGLVRVAGAVPRRVARWLGARPEKLVRMGRLGAAEDLVLYNACDVLPEEAAAVGDFGDARFSYRRTVLEEALRFYPRDRVRQAMYLDHLTFLCSLLDRNDRMTMGASIECRVPFLDYRLVEGLGGLPTSTISRVSHPKALLRRAVGDRLPRAVLEHRKWGFGVPWDRYLREEPRLRAFVQSLPDSRWLDDSPFDRARVRGLVRRFLLGQPETTALVRQLVAIALWHSVCVEDAVASARRLRVGVSA